TLLGTSFIVVSTQFSQSAKIRTRLQARGDSSRQLVQRAFYDLVRGPDPANVNSVLRTHSILEDMYGYGLSAQISDDVAAVVFTDPGGYDIPGALEFTLANARPMSPEGLLPPVTGLSDVPGYYNGHVLTFASGPLRGTSVRVVGYSGENNGFYTQQPYAFTVYREQSRDVPGLFDDINGNLAADVRGTQVVLNGRAYAGWGAGGITASGLGTEALEPNRVGQSANNYVASGPNESYDAADYQNMFLAAIDDSNTKEELRRMIPSFERENLFANGGGTSEKNFRAFGDPTNDPPVDNDGDGLPDSIWVDAGFPIQTDIDGRRYKPLVSYLVLDMDGRFNVNAHDNLYTFDRTNDGVMERGVNPKPGQFLLGGVDPFEQHTGAPAELPRGHYLGPPEIRLAPELFPVGNTDHEDLVMSRYGVDGHPGAVDYRDAWVKYQTFGHPDATNPDNFYPNASIGGLFGTQMDIHGRYGHGIPNLTWGASGVPSGMPESDGSSTFFEPDKNPNNEIFNSAYEFSLTPESRYATLDREADNTDFSDDQPYTAKEIEQILRKYDRDSRMLPSRLAQIIGNRDPNLIGHASFETPAIPGFESVESLGETGTLPVPITERVYNLLVNQGFSGDIENMIEQLVSSDVRMGLPFDLNRPFGDGRDNDGDGIYDERDELELGTETRIMVDGNDIPVGLNQYSRQNFAKQLFSLALLVTQNPNTALGSPNAGDTFEITDLSTKAAVGSPIDNDDVIRRMTLAQWVVNVVDFRDSDSICTPFEFDINPFNGWSPEADGNLLGPVDPTGETFVVWGCERPELLLTESVAFHDRRTQDLDSAGGGTQSSGDDDDFDSKLVPNASAFIELYRPWNQGETEQLNPREMGAFNGENGIDLMQESAPGNPVWRMVVTTEKSFSTTYCDVDDRVGVEAILEAEEFRRIYFATPDEIIEPAANRHKAYWPDATVRGLLGGSALLRPGKYAVIGSAGTVAGDRYDTWFGRRTEANWDSLLSQTRGITLLPATNQVEVREGSPNATPTMINAVAIPINETVEQGVAAPTVISRSLGFSDPTAGYYDYVGLSDVTPVPDGFEYVNGKDQPVDQDPAIQTDLDDRQILLQDGVSTNYRGIFLQRLADPTQAWNEVTNPYLTIDRQVVDLTIFNGADDDSGDSGITPSTVQLFASNERGRFRNPDLSSFSSPITERRQLWPIEPPSEDGFIINQAPLSDTHHFDFELIGSFGSVNQAYDQAEFQAPGTPPIGFGGLTWNNRPFANRMDLLDVPFTSTNELLTNPLATGVSGPTGLPAVGYSLDKLVTSGDPYSAPVRGGQFGHLFNFLSPGLLPSDPHGLVGLLDFVRVPSRFAGTQIHLNTSQTLLPPFNALSRYREPGKININTVLNPAVQRGWLGAIGQEFSVDGFSVANTTTIPDTTFVNQGVSSENFENARRGTGASAARFASPYRNANAWDKAPPTLKANNPVDSTLLRATASGNTPLFETDGTLPWADPARDSSFRNETLRRLGAITTNRSSVFAIWITVGKFEVDESGKLLTTPGGDGVELGADEGKNERSRGFYLIDRSIPVGCQPGVDHNVEKIILAETIMD
ncbi:MAG: hypothetical protein P8J33_07370, partial [Pirellulaceae bacterium]|nr:hypothetical protein [Pirellulaceae bacterium]